MERVFCCCFFFVALLWRPRRRVVLIATPFGPLSWYPLRFGGIGARIDFPLSRPFCFGSFSDLFLYGPFLAARTEGRGGNKEKKGGKRKRDNEKEGEPTPKWIPRFRVQLKHGHYLRAKKNDRKSTKSFHVNRKKEKRNPKSIRNEGQCEKSTKRSTFLKLWKT